MRLSLVVVLAGCTGATEHAFVASEHGPDMVRVSGDLVRLGYKKMNPVAGFKPPMVDEGHIGSPGVGGVVGAGGAPVGGAPGSGGMPVDGGAPGAPGDPGAPGGGQAAATPMTPGGPAPGMPGGPPLQAGDPKANPNANPGGAPGSTMPTTPGIGPGGPPPGGQNPIPGGAAPPGTSGALHLPAAPLAPRLSLAALIPDAKAAGPEAGTLPPTAPPAAPNPNSVEAPTGAAPPNGPPLATPGFVPPPDLGVAPGVTLDKNSRPMPDPLDARDVRVDDFWIDVTEVTQTQYQEFVEVTGYRPPFVNEDWANEDAWNWPGRKPPSDKKDHPVVLVNWYDATDYCAWAEKRLPTEAEWQLAVLGPKDDERVFPWGNEYDGNKLNHGQMWMPNYDDSDGYLHTSPVGTYPAGASRYGLEDAFGNAWEWMSDFRVPSWEDTLGERDGDVIVNPHTGTVGFYAAVRGGAYFFDLRPNPAGERNGFLVELRRKTSGFRCARDV